MNRTVVKHGVLLVLGACAFAAALLLVPRDRGVWEARFSYCIAPGNDGVPFLGGNKEWTERFRAPSFAHDVVAQCRARAVVEIDESAVAGFVTGATIRVSREGDCVVCDFSSRADSRRSAEELAQCYLAAMSLAVDESNRECARKASAEFSAALSESEALARAARENYAEAQRAGSAAADDFRADAEKLTSKCDVLRRELSEAEREASKQNECLVVVHPLAVVDGNLRGLSPDDPMSLSKTNAEVAVESVKDAAMRLKCASLSDSAEIVREALASLSGAQGMSVGRYNGNNSFQA